MSESFSRKAAEAFKEALERIERSLSAAPPAPADEVREPEEAYRAAPEGSLPEGALGDPRELGERAALLALAESAWRQHLGALLDAHEVQTLLHVGTRQAVSDRARRGGILALPTSAGRVYYPAFQFGPGGRPFPAVPRVLSIFARAEASPWTVASWFRTPQELLEGLTPAAWLGHGRSEERLLEAARRAAARQAPEDLGLPPLPAP
jgi:hypothetical protein